MFLKAVEEPVNALLPSGTTIPCSINDFPSSILFGYREVGGVEEYKVKFSPSTGSKRSPSRNLISCSC